MKNFMRLLLCVAIPLTVGYLGSRITLPEISGWYASLQKPWWNPPSALFGPVWTILYVLMGIACSTAWNSQLEPILRRTAMLLYGIQLVLNFCWSWEFFAQHAIGAALVVILFLWLMILLTIFAFGLLSSRAAWLLVPYISWVSFAALLNYSLWKLNG